MNNNLLPVCFFVPIVPIVPFVPIVPIVPFVIFVGALRATCR
jgi:hypothetical protein